MAGMTKAWEAIGRIASPVIATVLGLLAAVGFPLAVVLALLFPRLIAASRPGKLGLEEVLRNYARLCWECGLALVLLLGVAWLVFGNPWARSG
jgi:hypothetical protein